MAEYIRRRGRLFSAALACAVLMASSAALASASATEYPAAPSWKAPHPDASPVAVAQVVESPRVVPAVMVPLPAGAGWCIGLGAVLALGVLHTNRPREKPRLWA